MKKLFFVATIMLATIFSASVVTAAKPAATLSKIGNDISYPQCGSVLPKGQAFGIVGINGGKATTPNPCLRTQLEWATTSNGSVAAQPKVQLYVNTANPGEVIDQITTWPTNGETPYGSCDGTNTLACSYQYGKDRAAAQVEMFRNAAVAVGNLSQNPGDFTWWLDVETENTWQSGSDAALARNRAALEGMADVLGSTSAKVGVYSTNYQWDVIGGDTPETSSLYALDSWMAGARTERGAVANCQNAPLLPGGKVILSQYVSRGLDYDISCS